MEIKFENKITKEIKSFTSSKELNSFIKSLMVSVFQDMIRKGVNEKEIIDFCQKPNYEYIDKYSNEWKLLLEQYTYSDIQNYLDEHNIQGDIKKPNSYNQVKKRANYTGSAVFLGKKRTRSWAARIVIGKDANGIPLYYDINTFKEKLDAIVCLENYHNNPYPLKILSSKYSRIATFPITPYPLVPVQNKSSNIHRKDKSYYTFKQVFDEMQTKLFPNFEERSEELLHHTRAAGKYGIYTARNMIVAYNKCSELYDKIYAELTTSDFRDCIVNSGATPSSVKNIVILFKNMDKYAFEEKVITAKYAMQLNYNIKVANPKNPEKKTLSPRECFTYEQIQYLWNITPIDYRDSTVRDILLLSIYTGARADELLTTYVANVFLDKDYFIAGEKTAAGKNREIPIHHLVKPIIEKYYNADNEFLFTQSNGHKLFYKTYNLWYNENFIIHHKMLVGRTAHCGRHTLETEMQRLNIKSTIINSIIGHKNGSVGLDYYNHISLQEKIEAINMVTFKNTKIYILNSERKTS